MQTSLSAVCRMELFGKDVGHFHTEDLRGLLERFPDLAYSQRRDFYMVLYVESAEGEVIIDQERISAEGAKVIVIKPHCISQIKTGRQATGKLLCFTEDFFALRYNENVLSRFSLLQREAKPYIEFGQEQKERWDLLVGLLLQEFEQCKRDRSHVLRSYLNILLVELERLSDPLGFIKNKNAKHEKLLLFEKLIDRHFVDKKLPSAYAALLNVSPNYLNKICKVETGQTAGDMIRKRIVIEAQRLLHFTSLTVNEITDRLGFENASYFVTFFRRHTGCTPEQFRQKQG